MRYLIAALAAAVVLLTGCGSAESEDRQGSGGKSADRVTDVDKAEVFRNIDDFPNVERVCIDGLAFAATRSRNDSTSVAPNLIRVPEWDSGCGPQ